MVGFCVATSLNHFLLKRKKKEKGTGKETHLKQTLLWRLLTK
jgi:hypothetical protein